MNKLVCTIHVGHMRPNTIAWRTTSRITQIIIHLGRFVLAKIFPDHICLLVVNGPKNRPNKPLKFEPTSRAGIFLGYPIHPASRISCYSFARFDGEGL